MTSSTYMADNVNSNAYPVEILNRILKAIDAFRRLYHHS